MTGTGTWLVHLPVEQCETLLRTTAIGRLGVIFEGKPLVFPMSHVYVDGRIAFPTNAGTKLVAALTWPYVSYEIDGVDPDGLSAWSVMVTGHAEEILDLDERARLEACRD